MHEPLDPDLAVAVRSHLGLERVDPDASGLRCLYRAWCDHVPFDNLRKLIGLTERARPLPGDDADDFFRAWLEHGTGATCWASSNALFHLLEHCGFEVARVTAAMLDLPEPNHASNIVRVEEGDFLVDSSILSGEPVPVGSSPAAVGGDRFAVEVRPDAGTWVVSFPRAGGERMVCRLFPGPATAATYTELHERTRDRSVFNDRLHVTRHLDGGVWNLNDHDLTGWTDAGTITAHLDDEEREEWLRRAGYSDTVIERALAAEAGGAGAR